MRTEIIIATYNKPAYLALCLETCLAQTVPPDTICVADDGSGEETAAVIAAAQDRAGPVSIRHSWHEDDGFRKCKALNTAIAESQADYLFFIDDDCLLHPGFVSRHLDLARRDRFLTGSLIRLDPALTQAMLSAGRVAWSAEGRLSGWTPQSGSERLKSTPPAPRLNRALDRLSPVKRNWQGGCASTFRDNLLAVNGFDERMAYGGLDKELGDRLGNAGVRGRHVRYTAPVYHLDHGRAYDKPEVRAFNRGIIEDTRRTGRTWTEHGIVKGPRRRGHSTAPGITPAR
ncbi:glycosyltransferase [Celeribacter indicus]|uniref:Glycosyl transferase family protein n=1 Tax=Celeribacter indicus TaxID=1208324 RepID=A0A0B5E165_9RHOB|nr:glycosyltransferase [Celeribacter indicus]AJE49029.1 glycosyl transferase family protein [Celeribacter indicus]SDW44107.1 Glycosyltransferase, GT2 family [Celeribacter indicus]